MQVMVNLGFVCYLLYTDFEKYWIISGGELDQPAAAVSPVIKPATPQIQPDYDPELVPLETEEVSPEQEPSPGFEPEPIETEEVSPVPFDPPIEDQMDGRRRNKSKKKKKNKDKKKKKEDKKSHNQSQRNRGGPDQFHPFEAGSPVSPEDFGQLVKVRTLYSLDTLQHLGAFNDYVDKMR